MWGEGNLKNEWMNEWMDGGIDGCVCIQNH